MTEYVYKAAGSIVDAMSKDPQLQSPGGAGFNVAFGTNDNFLEYVSKRPEAAKVFGGTMEGMAKNPGFGHHHIVKGWQWESISGIVVDVSLSWNSSTSIPSSVATTDRRDAHPIR